MRSLGLAVAIAVALSATSTAAPPKPTLFFDAVYTKLASKEQDAIDVGGPSLRNAATHTWSVTGGTGGYRSGHGTVVVRDRSLSGSQLAALGKPPAQRTERARLLAARAKELVIIQRQDDAALAADAPAFVASVNDASADFRAIAISATLVRVTDCVL
jgi:hypothetical protein